MKPSTAAGLASTDSTRVIHLTADFAPSPREVERTDADTEHAESICCAACGQAQRLERPAVWRCAHQVVELACKCCGSVTLALCPQDLGIPLAPVRRVRGFFCRTLLCAQQFLLAPRAADVLLATLAPGQFSQRCPRCEVEFVVRLPDDVWSAFQTTLQRWHDAADLTPIGAMPINQRSDLLPGARLGGYVVEHAIAEGGAATVYSASDAQAGRVALKVLHGELLGSARIRRRFRREAEALTRSLHPHVVRLLDKGEDDGRTFLVLERLEGGSLRERLWQDSVLGADEAFRAFGQLCEALEAVHAAGFAHCDVKPENVVLCRQGDVKLIDFGIVELLGATPTREHPSDGCGSPTYMAPEQIHGGRIGPGADVYALGLTLYEVLTESWPWPEQRPISLAERVTHPRGSARASEMLARKSPVLSELLLECLAPDPSQRPSLKDVHRRIELARRRWTTPHVGQPGIFERLRARLAN